MIEWFTWVQFGIGILAGLICLFAAFADRKPSDFTAGSVVVVGVLTIVQLVMALVAPLFGNRIQGDGIEFWMYMITAAIIPPAAILWALIERTRWSNAVLAIAAFAVAVMVFRMQQIWVDAGAFFGA
ncbi:hypothetical protein [Gulosibacter molinativorax]|uniref:Integral membrane protein n=1 Tax=Gulosibacter molinativorax TaxID=256821 RepID=A0ABT7C3M0_9MICO|nr:hypothetical protein [Gulosibacter molinativorax]MDJ1369846.1 hypothetical protein [Gulosibacter molinativorax]QUY61811.1 Putative membrane protein [Gulosibacter molinativorax]